MPYASAITCCSACADPRRHTAAISNSPSSTALVTFPAASTILTSPDVFHLSNTQYRMMFIPRVTLAILDRVLGNGHPRTPAGRGIPASDCSRPDLSHPADTSRGRLPARRPCRQSPGRHRRLCLRWPCLLRLAAAQHQPCGQPVPWHVGHDVRRPDCGTSGRMRTRGLWRRPLHQHTKLSLSDISSSGSIIAFVIALIVISLTWVSTTLSSSAT